MNRDTTGKAVGKRSNNGRKPADLSAFIGTKIGTRTVTGTRWLDDHNRLVLLCTCGADVLLTPSAVRRGIGKCKSCGGRGERSEQAKKREAKNVMHDYEAWVDRAVNGFRIESYATEPRPMFTLRCSEGHRFPRLAWDVVSSAKGPVRCPKCAGQKERSADVARKDWRLQVAPEVCGCTYFNGVLRRVCGWCESEQRRGAA